MSDDETSPLIGDVTGAAKLADSRLVNKVYDDALSGPAKEFGQALTHVMKSCRLLLAPFQYAASWTDRLDRWYADITRDVPEYRQQQARPEVAGPVLQNLVFTDDDNPLVRLYLELLKRAIDKQRCDEVHPAFVKITSELSPDEAMVLYLIQGTTHPLSWDPGPQSGGAFSIDDFPKDQLNHRDLIWTYMWHLESLGLVSTPVDCRGQPKGIHVSREAFLKTARVQATPFGELFIRACIPEGFSLSGTS